MAIKGKHIKILYTYPGVKSTFVAKDIRLLSQHYQVNEYAFDLTKKKLLLWELLKQKLSIIKSLFGTSVYIVKFGGYWSLLSVLFARFFGKKSIIITGGTDCVSFPKMAYGNFQNNTLAWFTRKSFQNAHHIIALHDSMMHSDYSYDNCFFKEQGLKVHIPNLKTPYSIAYNGYDADLWKKTSEKKKGSFLTVASGLGEERRRILKGIDTILQIANQFPDNDFIIVGSNENELAEHPKNVILKPKSNAEELKLLYSQAEFYLQLSMSEGFPNSLCEAMLCECVPIVSNVASMPFIIDNSGFILMRKDINSLKGIVQKALESDTESLGKEARQRIAENFTEENRAIGLNKAIELVLSRPNP